MSSQVPRKVMPSLEPETPPSASFRRFLTRAEAVTLVGMLLVIFSLYLVWERYALPQNMVPLAGSMSLAMGSTTRTGQALPPSVRWTLLGSAVACGALLLWTPTARTRLAPALLQSVCALTCVGITLTWLLKFALQPGIVMALVGGMLLIWGALDRLSSAEPDKPK
jgi:hypothetical protein